MNKKLLYGICGIIALILTGKMILFKSPKISVVMSTYNRSGYLPRAIDSILNQTFSDFEFIIVDDGSTDNTPDILQKYADQDRRLKILTNSENKGLVYSLNRGLGAARGKYIARMDDDDISSEKRFEKQYQFMEENPDIALTSSFVANPDTHKRWGFQQQLDSDYMKTELYTSTVPISHPSIFIRRSFLKEHNIRYNEKYIAAEDRKFYLDLFDAGAKMGKIPEDLVLYRLHSSNEGKYYANQQKNSRLFIQDEILPRFDIQIPYTSDTSCKIFRTMVQANKTKNILPQEVLELLVEKKCPENPVQHPEWKDTFVFKDDHVCRLNKPEDCGKIQSRTKDSFTLKWDRWGVETFVRKDGIWYYQEPPKTPAKDKGA